MNDKIIYSDLEETYENLGGDGYNHFELLGRELVSSVKTYGLGVLPKSDLECLIFHCISNALENEFDDNIKILDYALMQMLKISPSKLRSLRVIRSAKYLNDLDYNKLDNKLRLARALRNVSVSGSDITTADIIISISDPHSQQLIERIIEDNKGVVGRTLNSKLLVLKPKQFLDLINLIFRDEKYSAYEEIIKEIKEENNDLYLQLTNENLLQKFKNAYEDKAIDKMLEVISKVVVKMVKLR